MGRLRLRPGPSSVAVTVEAGLPGVANTASQIAQTGRVCVLRGIAVFDALRDEALAELADEFGEERYESGARVFAEGDRGDRLLIVVEGEAELSAAGSSGRVRLATLSAGELVAELAVLAAPDRCRNATLTALTRLVLLSLSAERLLALLRANESVAAAFQGQVRELVTARFIKQVGPFMTLDDASRRWLANRVVSHSVKAGEAIVRQGEVGDSCYLLRSGNVEVLVVDGEGEQVVARIGPGSMVGEAALLTDSRHSATVRAVEHCEVLELHREDLEAVLAKDDAVGRELIHMVRVRERPVRDPAVEIFERRTRDGETITVLKHPGHLTYYRLSERGRFIWERLDGRHDLHALTLAILAEYGTLMPFEIADIVAGLAQTRMIRAVAMKADLDRQLTMPSRGDRILRGAKRFLEKEVSINNLDQRLSDTYNRGVRALFTRPAQAFLAVLVVGGLLAFVYEASTAHHVVARGHKQLLVFIIPGFFVSVFLHEAGHAFTVKAFGREVHRGGVGWYWFGPVAFVDTSDMWLGTRTERVLVSLAGPYVNLLLGGVASIGAVAAGSGTLTALLWSFALPSYVMVLANLNPLMEFDGYHVLSDLLDRPNLRRDALAWFGANFPVVLCDRRDIKRHRVDLAYSIGSIGYIIFSILAVLVLYRLTLRGLVGQLAPAWVSDALAWLLAVAVCVLAALATVDDLRRARRGR